KPATMSLNIVGEKFRNRGLGFHKLTAQQIEHDYRKKNIEEREYEEGNRDLVHGSDGFFRSHHAVNDPGLTAKLGHDPARLDRKESERPRCDQRAKKPFTVRNAALFPGEP